MTQSAKCFLPRLLVLLLILSALPAIARQAAAARWTHDGPKWSCSQAVTVTVPSPLTGSPEEQTLAVKMGDSHFYAAYGLCKDKKTATDALKKMRTHLSSSGDLKLGKIARISTNPKLHLVAREGQVKVNKTVYYVVMGYFTNKDEYLSFLVSYQASQASKFKPLVSQMMNSVVFQ